VPSLNDNLTGILTIIQRELIQPAESDVLKGYIREALWEFRGKPFLISEATADFTLAAADPSRYQMGYTIDETDSIPGDVMRILNLRSRLGTNYVPVRPVGIDELRELQRGGTISGNRPQVYCWFANSLEFWPTLSSSVDFRMDYQRDPSRGASGDEFTEDSPGSFSNHFFMQHRDLLVSYVLIRWGLGRGRDPELAQNQSAVYNKALSKASRDYAIAKIGSNAQVAAHF
jgi:hypothetical protein